MRRSPLEMNIDILRVISGGETKPTNIMGVCKINYATAQRLLDRLVERGFLVFRDGKDRRSRSSYMLTQEGYEMLDEYDEFIGKFS